MSKFIKPLTFAAAVLIALPSYALQIKTAIDDEPILASISMHELTRIFVDGDRISNVVGINGSYLLQNDEQQGAIFIKPTANYIAAVKRAKEIEEKKAEEKIIAAKILESQRKMEGKANESKSAEQTASPAKETKEPEQKAEKTKSHHSLKPLNVFISTTSGHNYILLLTPANINSETIMLKPKHSAYSEKKSPMSTDAQPSYQQNLVRLVNAMVNGTVSDEYTINHFNISKKPQYKLDQADLFLVSVYSNEELRGEIYKVVNNSETAITITEQQFYRDGVRAVTIKDHVILPFAETFIYLVI